MNKTAFKQFPKFETERLFIRPFKDSDFYDYVRWHDTGEIRYHVEGLYDFKKDNKQGFIKFFLQRVPQMFETKLSGIWCIAEKSTDKNVGLIEVCKYDAYPKIPTEIYNYTGSSTLNVL